VNNTTLSLLMGLAIATVLAVAGASWFAGSDAAPEPATVGASVAESALAGSTEPGKTKAAQHFIGKPRPPISVRVADAVTLHSGVPATLVLEIASEVAVDALSLQVEGDAGLVLTGTTTFTLAGLVAGERASVTVSLTPSSGGAQRLAGFLTFDVGGQRQGMPLSIPLQVDGPVTIIPVSSKLERAPQRDATGELVYPMPAE
jgi:hypothetical protein